MEPNRRQSTNVDDRRANWLIYEAFNEPVHQPTVIADNVHTRAVEAAADRIRSLKAKVMDQNEFDFLLETEPLARTVNGKVRYRLPGQGG